jgi:hypothetical protein
LLSKRLKYAIDAFLRIRADDHQITRHSLVTPNKTRREWKGWSDNI